MRSFQSAPATEIAGDRIQLMPLDIRKIFSFFCEHVNCFDVKERKKNKKMHFSFLAKEVMYFANAK